MVKAESCKNYHLLTPHWFEHILLCYAALWIPGGMESGRLCNGGAGRQHGACSETFWASCIMLFVFSGEGGRVTGRTESLPESHMLTFSPSSLSPLVFSISRLFTGNSQHHWCGLFLRVAWEQRNCTSLACRCRLFLPPFLCLSFSLYNLSSCLSFISPF